MDKTWTLTPEDRVGNYWFIGDVYASSKPIEKREHVSMQIISFSFGRATTSGRFISLNRCKGIWQKIDEPKVPYAAKLMLRSLCSESLIEKVKAEAKTVAERKLNKLNASQIETATATEEGKA